VTDTYLGIIAVAVAAMAVIQVVAIAVAFRASKRAGDALARFENDVRPILTNLKTMSADAAKTAQIASTQAQRAEQLIGDLTARVNDTVSAVEASVVNPAREAYAIIQGLLAAFAAFRQGPAPASHRPPSAEEEDALFIG
jgi:dihydroxyacetone kinase-like predicted kinase